MPWDQYGEAIGYDLSHVNGSNNNQIISVMWMTKERWSWMWMVVCLVVENLYRCQQKNGTNNHKSQTVLVFSDWRRQSHRRMQHSSHGSTPSFDTPAEPSTRPDSQAPNLREIHHTSKGQTTKGIQCLIKMLSYEKNVSLVQTKLSNIFYLNSYIVLDIPKWQYFLYRMVWQGITNPWQVYAQK